MTAYNLDRVFRPSSVAVIEDGPEGEILGPRVRKSLREGGYAGKVFRVALGRRSTGDSSVNASLSDLGPAVDLAVLAAPPADLPLLVERCSQVGIAGAVVLPPLGDAAPGQTLETETRILKQTGVCDMRLIGLESLGIVSPHAKCNASLLHPMPSPGGMAFVSQSGSLGEAILDHALRERIGFSHFIHVGSMLDIDLGDLVNYLGSDANVRSIVLQVDRLTRVRKFISACRSVARTKPIVVLKPLRQERGKPTGVDRVYDAAFERAGIVRVNTIEELFDCAQFLGKRSIAEVPGLAVITNARGPVSMALASLSVHDIHPEPLGPETIRALDELLPLSWNRENPIHVFREASPERYGRVVETCIQAKEIHQLLIIYVPGSHETASGVARSLADVLRDRPIPAVAVWMGGARADAGRRILSRAGIPAYTTPERAVATLASLATYRRHIQLSLEVPPKLPHAINWDMPRAKKILFEALRRGDRGLTKAESKGVLEAYGIPFEPSSGPPVPEAGFAPSSGLAETGSSPAASEQEVRANAARYPPERGTPSPADGSGVELRLSIRSYPEFGPAIFLGLGGIWSDLIGEEAAALPPLNRLLAGRLVEKTCVCRLLDRSSGTTSKERLKLEEMLMRFSQLATDFPEIEGMAVSLPFLGGRQMSATATEIRIRPTDLPSPFHLVMSLYPNQYEWRTVTKGDIEIFVRPIKPEDAPLLIELFHSMSDQSLWFRFMGPVRDLSAQMLHQLTQIDYDRDIALVALEQSDQGEKMLGCCHFVRHPRHKWAEFAAMVGDAWQGNGVGAKLLEYGLTVARQRGIESVRGLVSAQNRNMLALADRFKMTRTRVPDTNEYDLQIELYKV